MFSGWLELKDLQPFRAHYEERVAAETKKTKKWRRALQLAEECEQRGGQFEDINKNHSSTQISPNNNVDADDNKDESFSSLEIKEDSDNEDTDTGAVKQKSSKKSQHKKHKTSQFENKEPKKHKHKHKHKQKREKKQHKKEKWSSETKESSESGGASLIKSEDNHSVEHKKTENPQVQSTKNEASTKPQKRKYEMMDRDKSLIEEERNKRIKTTSLPTVEHLTKLAQYLRLALRNNVQQSVLSLSLSLSLSLVYEVDFIIHRFRTFLLQRNY
jgi:hypothetical protein